VNGATAKLGVSTTGLLTASGVTFLDAQDDDLVYNANGIDGTTVTEFTFDYPNVQVDINDPDGSTTITRLYAWWANERTTEDGIRTLIGGSSRAMCACIVMTAQHLWSVILRAAVPSRSMQGRFTPWRSTPA
jgi:hypothetical protein